MKGRRTTAALDGGRVYWLAGLLVLVLNLLGLFVFAKAHPKQDGWQWLWSYAESDTAKLLFASLVFPLVLFFVERHFNVLQALRDARTERRRKVQDAQTEERVKSIEQTFQVWSQFTDWVGSVVYWDGTSSLQAALREGWRLTVAAEDAINGWALFRNLVKWEGPGAATDLELHFLRLTNALLMCTQSTIYYLGETTDPSERESLQTSLDLIAGAVDTSVHHPVRNILYASLELLEIEGAADSDELRFIASDEEAVQRRSELEQKIAENLEVVRAWSAVVEASLDECGLLATATGSEVDAVRASLADESGALRTKYLAIPRAERLHAWRYSFTRAWLDTFADEMAFQLFWQDVAQKTQAT